MPVTRLSLGTAQLGNTRAGRAATSDVHASSLLHSAYELGIASFDTAPYYGSAEQRIGAFLRDQNLHEEIAICTKLPALDAVDTGRVVQYVEDCLTASLRRLRGDVIDTYLVRSAADLARHGDALVDALAHQRDKGRILSIGVAVRDPAELAVLEEFPELGAVEHPLSLADRRLLTNDWPERLARGGMRLRVCDVSLGEALDAEVAAVIEPFAVAGADVALSFVLSIDPDCVVVTADSIPELEALVAAAAIPLPPGLAAALRPTSDPGRSGVHAANSSQV
jgi:aryl-alcohol dehydrogenase-like predicted oxidoreductase